MEVSAVLSRGKGRDFHDLIFLLQRTQPDYKYLMQKCHIAGKEDLKKSLLEVASSTDLQAKARDFSHLVLDPATADRVLRFPQFVESL